MLCIIQKLVQPRILNPGTLRTDLLCRIPFGCGRDFSGFSDRNLSYRERLRSGLVDIKADDAVNLFQDMLQFRPLPTVIDFNRLFTCVVRIKSLPLRGVKPDVKTYNIMISGLCKKGSLSEANKLFRKMEGDGHAPNDCTYNTLIRAHLRGSDVITSAELIEEMKKGGFSADASTTKMVIDMLSDGRLEKSFLDMLS